jgi:hypothetical protein
MCVEGLRKIMKLRIQYSRCPGRDVTPEYNSELSPFEATRSTRDVTSWSPTLPSNFARQIFMFKICGICNTGPLSNSWGGQWPTQKLDDLFLPLHSTGRCAAKAKGKESSNIKHNLFTLTFDITVFNVTSFVSFYSSATCFGHTGSSSGTTAIVPKAVSLSFWFFSFYAFFFICLMYCSLFTFIYVYFFVFNNLKIILKP